MRAVYRYCIRNQFIHVIYYNNNVTKRIKMPTHIRFWNMWSRLIDVDTDAQNNDCIAFNVCLLFLKFKKTDYGLLHF